jgi:hypothetical protein
LPINVRQLKAASGFSVVDQFRGAFVPLAAALLMALAVLGVKAALPASLHATAHLVILVPVGAVAFVAALSLLNRALVVTLVGFVRSALRKAHPTREPLAEPALSLGRTP